MYKYILLGNNQSSKEDLWNGSKLFQSWTLLEEALNYSNGSEFWSEEYMHFLKGVCAGLF